MGAQRGRGAGVRGLIDFQQPGFSAPTNVAFTADIQQFANALTCRVIKRTGPGSNGLPQIRLADLRGGGAIVGKMTWAGYPFPTSIQYATGQITLTYDATFDDAGVETLINGVSFPVQLSNIQFTHDEGEDGTGEETWAVSFTWALAGAVSITWQGTQLSISTPAKNEQQTYEGFQKTYDQHIIRNTDTQRIDIQNLPDDDITETAELAALLAAAVTPPQPYEKIVTLTMTKAEDDSVGAYVIIQWGLQDSKDDVETPRWQILTDPNDLTDHKQIAIVYAVGSPPATPAAPANMKFIDYTDNKINDVRYFRLFRYGKIDSVDSHEMPATWTITDQSGLQSRASVGKIDGIPAVPSGFDLRSSKDQSVVGPNTGTPHVLTVADCGLRTIQQDAEFPNTFNTIDPFDVDSTGRETIIFDRNGSTPGATVPSGLQLIATTIIQETSDTTTHMSRVVYQYAINNSLQRITYPQTYSTRSAIAPYQDVVTEIVADSVSTVATLANDLWALYQGIPYIFDIRTKRITPRLCQAQYHYVNPGIMVISTLVAEPRWIAARKNGSTVEVWAAQVVTRGSGSNWIRIGYTLYNNPIRKITIRRLLSGSTVPDFPAQINTVNDDVFLGLSAGTCYYAGAVDSTNTELSGTLPFYIQYSIINDPNGKFVLKGFTQGWIQTTASPTPGSWVDAATLTGAGLSYDLPSSSDFDNFIT